VKGAPVLVSMEHRRRRAADHRGQRLLERLHGERVSGTPARFVKQSPTCCASRLHELIGSTGYGHRCPMDKSRGHSKLVNRCRRRGPRRAEAILTTDTARRTRLRCEIGADGDLRGIAKVVGMMSRTGPFSLRHHRRRGGRGALDPILKRSVDRRSIDHGGSDTSTSDTVGSSPTASPRNTPVDRGGRGTRDFALLWRR